MGERYIEEAPASLDDVERNLLILQDAIRKDDPLNVA